MRSNPQTFRWHFYIFDIDAINHDIRLGVLSGVSVQLRRKTIEWFAENILGLIDSDARLFPQVPTIDKTYAKDLPASRINEPILLTPIEVVLGAVCYDPFSAQILKPMDSSKGNIVIIDGNHRLTAAYYQGRHSLDGILLPNGKMQKYLRDAR